MHQARGEEAALEPLAQAPRNACHCLRPINDSSRPCFELFQRCCRALQGNGHAVPRERRNESDVITDRRGNSSPRRVVQSGHGAFGAIDGIGLGKAFSQARQSDRTDAIAERGRFARHRSRKETADIHGGSFDPRQADVGMMSQVDFEIIDNLEIMEVLFEPDPS